MGSSDSLLARSFQTSLPPPQNGSHEGDEGDEEDLCALGQAPRLRRQGHQDRLRPRQGGSREEQGGQDRLQEDVGQGGEEPMDRGSRGRQEGAQHQGLRSNQEGLRPLQEGQGALQEVSECERTAALESLRMRGHAWSFDGSPPFLAEERLDLYMKEASL